jgi:hypothetical protein
LAEAEAAADTLEAVAVAPIPIFVAVVPEVAEVDLLTSTQL